MVYRGDSPFRADGRYEIPHITCGIRDGGFVIDMDQAVAIYLSDEIAQVLLNIQTIERGRKSPGHPPKLRIFFH